METIISPRRIEWMQHILSQLFHHPQATSITGEIQTSKHRRQNHVAYDNKNNKNNNNYNYNNNATLAQRNTKSSRRSTRTALPVAMGNESFSWEPCPTNDLRSLHMYSNEAVSFQKPKSKRKDKQQKHSLASSTSSWRVSCLLAFLGLSLITITLSPAGVNPFDNPLSQLRMKMQPTIEDADMSSGTSSLPIETLTMLFLRSAGISLLLHSILAFILPFQVFQTSKVALLYGMAILAAGQALTNYAIRIPCSGIAVVFWFLAGWESWMTWDTTDTLPTSPSTVKSKSSTILNDFNSSHEMQQQQNHLLLQYLVDDVAQTAIAVTLPLLIATLGIPHMLSELLLKPSTQQLLERDEEEWTTTTSTLFLSIRLFGVCQFAFAVLIMDWKGRMRWSLQQQQQQQQQSRLHQPYNPFLLWLPLFHLVIVNVPLYLSIMTNMEDMMLLGACLVIGQMGVGVWMIFRTVGTLQYTQGHS